MSAIIRARSLVWAMMFAMVVLLGACGGDSTPDIDNNGIRPSITSLSTNSANAGDQVFVNGVNFGTTRGSSSIRLNGVDFAVNEWTDTRLDVSVSTGMTSGIVVALRDGLASQSGAEAQLFVGGGAIVGPPVIGSINPGAHPIGSADPVTFTGNNFGTAQGTSKVFFTAQGGAVSQAGVVEANVATRMIGDTEVPSWTNSAIDVYVPATATSGDAYVVVGGIESNKLFFEALPGGATYAPEILAVTPDNGAPGETIIVTGEQFGTSQGGSTMDIASTPVIVISWTMNEIVFKVPEGAITGFLTINVTGNSDWVDFTVADKPFIGGVSPSDLKINQSVTINGGFFGTEQGSGQLSIENTNIPVDVWQDDLIVVNNLPPLSPADRMVVPVSVTNAAGLVSEIVEVMLTSDLTASVTASPRAGKANHPDFQNPNGDGTEFSFFVDVAGGSDDYSYALLEKWDDPATTQAETTVSPVLYRFDTLGNYHTGMQVRDNVSGDTIVVEGPILNVVDHDEPVITAIGIAGFDNGGLDGPNNLSYYPGQPDGEPHYYDFAIDDVNPVFSSDLTDVMVAGSPQKGVTRNLNNFFVDGTDPRPYGYRYSGSGNGSRIGLEGFNFGDTTGTLFLRSEGPEDTSHYELAATDIIDWGDEYIEFRLPAGVDENLSGRILVVPITTTKTYLSDDPLICSAYYNVVGPPTISLSSIITINGYDLLPPVAGGLTGNKTYMIWKVNATYADEFAGGANASGKVIAIIPVEVTAGSTTFNFDMANLGATREIEYLNGVIEGRTGIGTLNDPLAGEPTVEYSFFLWTGAMDPTGVSVKELARSGVFSQGWNLNVGGEPVGGNDPPNAVMTADVTNGPPTLDVVFTVSSSNDPDGTIDIWEFDDGLGGGFVASDNTDKNVSYDTEGTYNARLRVTDNEGDSDVATVVITCGAPPTNWTLEIGVSILTATPEFGQPFEVISWNEGGEFMAFDLSHETLGPLGTITCDTAGLLGANNYEVFYGSMLVPEGFVIMTPTLAPVGGWAIPLSGPPYAAAMFGDKTLANGDAAHFIDFGAFAP